MSCPKCYLLFSIERISDLERDRFPLDLFLLLAYSAAAAATVYHVKGRKEATTASEYIRTQGWGEKNGGEMIDRRCEWGGRREKGCFISRGRKRKMGEKGECEKGPPERNQQFRPFSPGRILQHLFLRATRGGWRSRRWMEREGIDASPAAIEFRRSKRRKERSDVCFFYVASPRAFLSFLFLAPFLPAPFSFINEAAQYRHFPLSLSVFNTGDAPPVSPFAAGAIGLGGGSLAGRRAAGPGR